MSHRPCRALDTSAGRLACAWDPGTVYRIGFPPDPWAWPGWEFARNDGRFGGRWDDANGEFRTVYAASTMLGCLLEVLAPLRPDPLVTAALDQIVEGEEDAADHPTANAGTLNRAWITARRATAAQLAGIYCCVTETESIATLRPHFLAVATVELDLPDFDAAVLRSSRPRELTQRVASWLWEQATVDGKAFDGVRFFSRYGDEHELWAVFERDEDGSVSSHLSHVHPLDLEGHPDLPEAMRIHGLRWA